jgi:hypothetical protein
MRRKMIAMSAVATIALVATLWRVRAPTIDSARPLGRMGACFGGGNDASGRIRHKDGSVRVNLPCPFALEGAREWPVRADAGSGCLRRNLCSPSAEARI